MCVCVCAHACVCVFVCVYVINDLAFIYIHANTIIVFATDHILLQYNIQCFSSGCGTSQISVTCIQLVAH